MRSLLATVFFGALTFYQTTAAAQQTNADIAVALTDEIIEVDTDFSGAPVTLFGAVYGVENPAEKIDVIAVVRGPTSEFTIRQLEKNSLIWTPGEAHHIHGAPGLYLTKSTKRISDIAPLPDQAEYRLGIDNVSFSIDAETKPIQNMKAFENAFLNEIEDIGLYDEAVGEISFKKESLFSIVLQLPANTPVGEYGVEIYLYRDGIQLGSDTARLFVNKVGIERQIYDLAHERPVSYGIICVVISLFAGWAASLAFRK